MQDFMMNLTANLPALIVVIAGLIAVVVEVLKHTKFPTDKPKTVVFFFVALAVAIPYLTSGRFTTAMAPEIGSVIAATSVVAYGLYDIFKSAYDSILKYLKN